MNGVEVLEPCTVLAKDLKPDMVILESGVAWDVQDIDTFDEEWSVTVYCTRAGDGGSSAASFQYADHEEVEVLTNTLVAVVARLKARGIAF